MTITLLFSVTSLRTTEEKENYKIQATKIQALRMSLLDFYGQDSKHVPQYTGPPPQRAAMTV